MMIHQLLEETNNINYGTNKFYSNHLDHCDKLNFASQSTHSEINMLNGGVILHAIGLDNVLHFIKHYHTCR